MSTLRLVKSVVIGLAVLAVGFTQAAAAPQLLLHWDRESDSSKAVVHNDDGDVLAEFPWAGPLPRKYSPGHDENELPTFIVAKLRDQLAQSVQPGAGEALAFIRDLLGVYADTPVEETPVSLETWISYEGRTIVEWCGTVVNGAGECTEPGDPMFQNAVCSNAVCKRTTIEPGQ
jgi:hypothetical protein